jgi:hypothetical protein
VLDFFGALSPLRLHDLDGKGNAFARCPSGDVAAFPISVDLSASFGCQIQQDDQQMISILP